MKKTTLVLAQALFAIAIASAQEVGDNPRPTPTAEPTTEARPTPSPRGLGFPRMAKLSSGKEVEVLGMGMIAFRQAPPGLALSYRTKVSIDDIDTLRAEAEEIWRDFRHDADKAKVTSAIIMANEPTTGGLLTTNRSYNFVFERRDDGSWPDKPK